MKKNEPLKGKILRWNQLTGDIETINGKYFLETATENGKYVKIFLKSDVKSAVEGLLEEISKLDRIELEEFSDEQFDNLHDPDEVIVHAVDYFKHLVKKWFADVCENE